MKDKHIYNVIRDISKQILFIILYVSISIILSLIFYRELMSKNIIIKNVFFIITDIILLLVFSYIFRKTLINDFKNFKKGYIKKYFKYWLLGLTFMIISNILISFFITLPTNEQINREIITQIPIYGILTTCIFSPIIEELLVRAPLKDTFKNNYVYYITSALIFASLHLIAAKHLYEILYLIPYGALGYSLAYIYKNSNNIWTNIFFHGLHNSIAIVIILLGDLA